MNPEQTADLLRRLNALGTLGRISIEADFDCKGWRLIADYLKAGERQLRKYTRIVGSEALLQCRDHAHLMYHNFDLCVRALEADAE